MDLHIMPIEEALRHEPTKPTYAIRIFLSEGIRPPSLKVSPLYRKIAEYVFDDNDTNPIAFELGPKWFDEQIAESIIRDFNEYISQVESLLVHCIAGKNRSPAVAMALNDIFRLGYNTESLKQEYERYNHFIYETMVKVARELRI